MTSLKKCFLIVLTGLACLSAEAAEFMPLQNLYGIPAVTPAPAAHVQPIPLFMQKPVLAIQKHWHYMVGLPSVGELLFFVKPSSQFVMAHIANPAANTTPALAKADPLPNDETLLQQISSLQKEISGDIDRLNATHIEISKLRIQTALAHAKPSTPLLASAH